MFYFSSFSCGVLPCKNGHLDTPRPACFEWAHTSCDTRHGGKGRPSGGYMRTHLLYISTDLLPRKAAPYYIQSKTAFDRTGKRQRPPASSRRAVTCAKARRTNRFACFLPQIRREENTKNRENLRNFAVAHIGGRKKQSGKSTKQSEKAAASTEARHAARAFRETSKD